MDVAATPVRYLVRVWLPDRPGALGQVASRIGTVRGDVIGIEILERGAGRVIDEIVVELPSAALVPLLVKEINEVDGVDVEEVRAAEDGAVDPWLDALESAARLVGSKSADDVIATLCSLAHRAAGSVWSVVVHLDTGEVLTSEGQPPNPAWIDAFIAGSRLAARSGTVPAEAGDVTWVPLPARNLALILGREGTAFRAKERRQAAALARIADAWLGALFRERRLQSQLAHPSNAA